LTNVYHYAILWAELRRTEREETEMAKRFFRVQTKGISFDEMVNYDSLDGGDDGEVEGLAVSGEPDGMDGGSRFGGAWDAMDDDDDVVILEGKIIASIYDGYRIRPTREVTRFTVAEWSAMLADGSAFDYR
jgi:hypothetical protein